MPQSVLIQSFTGAFQGSAKDLPRTSQEHCSDFSHPYGKNERVFFYKKRCYR